MTDWVLRLIDAGGYWGIALLGKDETWYRLPDAQMASLDPSVTAKYFPNQTVAAKQPPTVGSVVPKPKRPNRSSRKRQLKPRTPKKTAVLREPNWPASSPASARCVPTRAENATS